MKLFLDTNVLLDVILNRENSEKVKRILTWAEGEDNVRIYISYLTIANTAHILRKISREEQRCIIKRILDRFNILSSNDMQISDAIGIESPDFEDSLQIACAEAAGCNVILTRNAEHFSRFTSIPVRTPDDFCR